MSTTLTTTQLQQQYIAYFGRPGDPSGITNWLNSGLTEEQFAEKIYAQDEYKTTTIASKSTQDQVNSLYVNLFGRSADAEGLLFWTGEILAGRKTLSNLALDLIWSANNPISANTAQGEADALALTNKVAAAKLFTADVKADPAAILAYAPETLGADFKAGAAFDSAKTWLATVSTTAVTDAAVDTAVSNMTSASTTTTGTTVTLTDKVDAVSGGAYNDTFVGSNTTLTTGDSLTGGSGTDVLRYTATGASAVTENGFTTSSVETLKIQSDAVGGTTFTATGSTDVSKVINTLSTTDVTVDGLKALTTVELTDVQAGDTQVKFNDDLLTGSADAVTLNLDGNVTTAGGSIGTITLGNTSGTGVETVNVNTSGAASEITSIAGGLQTLNVTGDKDLTISGALAGVTTIAASAFTGKLSVVVDSDTTSKDVVVTGGTGDDTADFSDGFNTSDSFTGGEGTDTIKLTQAVASGSIDGTLSGVEKLGLSDIGTGTIDMDSFSGITTVDYDAGIAASATTMVDDAVSGITVHADAEAGIVTASNLTVDLKTDGTSDVITIDIDKIDTTVEGWGTINAADAETLNISFDDDSTDSTGAFTLATLVATDATTINLSGDSEFTLTATTDPSTAVLATLDASGATDKVSISGTDFAKGGATITLGSANDTLTFSTNATGADTIDLSKGGDDIIVYTAKAQSDTDRDIVKGFVSGSDDIDLTGLALTSGLAGIVSSSQFAGVGASFAEAQGLLDGTKVAVFNAATNVLWVDIDEDSVLEGATDFQVKLDGVSSITSADLTLGSGVTATSKQVAFNTATKTHFTEGKALTNEDDTIVTTVAHLAGSTIDGKGGDDTINVTAASPSTTFSFSGITFGDVETMTIGSNVSGITMNVADLTAAETNSITGVTNTTQTLTLTGGTVDLKPITLRKIETIATGSETVRYEFDTDNLTDVTTLNLAGGGADTIELAGGTYDFSAITMTSTAISTLDLNTADNLAKTLTVDAADFTGFIGGVIGETTTDITTSIAFNDTDDISAYTVSNVDTVTIGGTNQTLTVDEADFTATNFTTVTGGGDSNLTISGVGGTNNAVDLSNTTISGFDTITTNTGTEAITLDAATIGSTAVTLVGDTTSDITVTEDVDLTQLTLNASDWQSVTLAAGVDLTVDNGMFAGAVDALIGNTNGTLTFNMDAAASINLGGITGTGLLSTSIVATTGNDTLETFATNTAGTFTIATGTGEDIVRIGGEDAGNKHSDGASLFTAVVADAVRITDFDATKDQIAVPTGAIETTPATVGATASGAHNSATGHGFALLTGATLNDFSSDAGFYAAVGSVNGTADDASFIAIQNAAGTQVGVYKYDCNANANAIVTTADDVTLVAVIDVTGTFATSNMAFY